MTWIAVHHAYLYGWIFVSPGSGVRETPNNYIPRLRRDHRQGPFFRWDCYVETELAPTSLTGLTGAAGRKQEAEEEGWSDQGSVIPIYIGIGPTFVWLGLLLP